MHVQGVARLCARQRKSPAAEVAARLGLLPIGTAGFEPARPPEDHLWPARREGCAARLPRQVSAANPGAPMPSGVGELPFRHHPAQAVLLVAALPRRFIESEEFRGVSLFVAVQLIREAV